MMIRFLAGAAVFGLVAYEFLGADYFGPTILPRIKTRPASQPVVVKRSTQMRSPFPMQPPTGDDDSDDDDDVGRIFEQAAQEMIRNMLRDMSAANDPPPRGWVRRGDPPAPPAAPSTTPRSSARTLTIASDHGGFSVKCSADDGEWQHCIADTGAAHPDALLVLDRSAARAAGIDFRRLSFDGWASTANGEVRTAFAYVSRLQIGPFIVRDAPVVVNDGEIGDPLITTAFLRRYTVTISADTMTISEAGR